MSMRIRQPTAADRLSGDAADCSVAVISGRQAWRRIESGRDVRCQFFRRGMIVDRAIAFQRFLFSELLGHERRARHLTNRRTAIHFGVLRRLAGHVPVHGASRHCARSGEGAAGGHWADCQPQRTQDRDEQPGHDLRLCHYRAQSTRGNAGAVRTAELSGFHRPGFRSE